MVMSPEERRQRMHKALEREDSQSRNARVSKRRAGMKSQDFMNTVNSYDENKEDDFTAVPRRTSSEVRNTPSEERRASSEIRRTSADVPRRRASAEAAAVSSEKADRRERPERAERQERSKRPEQTELQERPKRKNSAPKKRRPEAKSASAASGLPFDPKIIAAIIIAIVVVVIAAFALKSCVGKIAAGGGDKPGKNQETTEQVVEEETEPEEELPQIDYMADAKLMAAQYDYDGAIDLVKTMPDYDSNEEAKAFVAQCEETKGTLVEQNIQEITHVFFHILTVDAKNSFDASKWGNQAGGYNSLMTTIDEFKKMMQEMYDKGYVMVALHDLAEPVENADGTTTMKKGSIMLPPGKKAFVMSEDDVCYYEYMQGAGYADKMIIGEDGRPTLHYTDKDGNEFVGDYDLLGVLDTFVDEHPDFSYHGHKACLVFTGYNGILGYRTDESYDPNSEYYDPKLEQGHDVEAERREAVEVLKAIVADGYEVGSHSWGHRDLGQIEYARFTKDCDRWNRNVASLIKEATGKQPDIIIYPKGADVADWHGYSHSNERFNYMHKLGFRYFCNVDSSQYWVQLGDDYLRQGRRALDGYNMWNDMANGYHRLSDLFDNVSDIFDPARPTPVPAY